MVLGGGGGCWIYLVLAADEGGAYIYCVGGDERVLGRHAQRRGIGAILTQHPGLFGDRASFLPPTQPRPPKIGREGGGLKPTLLPSSTSTSMPDPAGVFLLQTQDPLKSGPGASDVLTHQEAPHDQSRATDRHETTTYDSRTALPPSLHGRSGPERSK